METILKIAKIEIPVKSSADIPRMYRKRFNTDLFVSLAQFELAIQQDPTAYVRSDVIEMFENLAYCMAKSADKSITDDVEEWLAQFDDAMAIFNAIPQILAIWRNENKTTSKIKKKEGKSTEK